MTDPGIIPGLAEFGGMQHRLVYNAFLCTLLIQMCTTWGCQLFKNDGCLQNALYNSMFPTLRCLNTSTTTTSYKQCRTTQIWLLFPETVCPALFRCFFICSGCDYVSYFSGLGKVAFLNTYQHAPFISRKMLPGILS